MFQRHIRKPAALGHHGAIFAGSGFIQADLCQSHGIILGIVHIPQGDGARVVFSDVDDAADIPPLALHVHFLIIAVAGAHLPPAVPFAVPPIQQGVAAPGGRRRCIATAPFRRFPAEGGRVDGDLAALGAEHLLKLHLHLAGGILQHEGGLYLHRLARLHILHLVVRHRRQDVIIRIDDGDIQHLAILRGRFGNAPQIRVGFIAVVGIVQRQNQRVVSVGILHDAGIFIEDFIVAQLDQIGICRFIILIALTAGSKAKQHQRRKQQAKDICLCPFHTSLPKLFNHAQIPGSPEKQRRSQKRPGVGTMDISYLTFAFGCNCHSCR